MELPPDTAALILAAGAGSRFHGASHKLLALLNGHSVYQRALACVIQARFAHLIVVTGAVALELPDNVTEVHNPNWRSGQASSLRTGLDAADRLGCNAVVVGLGDQPFLTTSAWRDVALCPASIAVATYAGERGHPVRLAP